jgi:hypothetical protein
MVFRYSADAIKVFCFTGLGIIVNAPAVTGNMLLGSLSMMLSMFLLLVPIVALLVGLANISAMVSLPSTSLSLVMPTSINWELELPPGNVTVVFVNVINID